MVDETAELMLSTTGPNELSSAALVEPGMDGAPSPSARLLPEEYAICPAAELFVPCAGPTELCREITRTSPPDWFKGMLVKPSLGCVAYGKAIVPVGEPGGFGVP